MTLNEFIDAIHASHERDKDTNYVFFLGAGCSKSSGIPLAGELAVEWFLKLKKETYKFDKFIKKYLDDKIRKLAEERLEKEDLSDKEKYHQLRDKVVTLYFQLFEALFPDMIDRQKEIQRLTEGKYPGLGYYNLADLMKRKAFNVVMTTNFDDLMHDALLYSGQSKRARVISHHHLAQYIDRGETPHIVKLHGDAHLHPFNDKENTQEIEESLANSVQTLLANTKLIVIGYGGGDKSIAKLLESVSRQGMVYWCNKETPEKTELEEWWNSLPHKQHVEEFDFDKIMNAFGDKFKLKAPNFNKFATQLKSQYDESFKKETQEAIENNDIDELQKLISQSLRSGKYEKGLESALEAKKLIEGEEDNAEMLVDINNTIGEFYIHLAKYDKAIELLEETLTIELGENHPFTATSYNNIGSAWDSKGEYDKAMKYHEKALKIRLATLGENHPLTATSYNNIGSVWNSKGEYDKAIEYYEKALTILGKVYPDGHPDIETVEKNLKSAKESLDNTD
ncbi:MAG: tetratricopeptide repeat protein [Sulfurovum sp.]|nr:tetratricopeptide repeat protein [Sulfurovum sp.]